MCIGHHVHRKANILQYFFKSAQFINNCKKMKFSFIIIITELEVRKIMTLWSTFRPFCNSFYINMLELGTRFNVQDTSLGIQTYHQCKHQAPYPFPYLGRYIGSKLNERRQEPFQFAQLTGPTGRRKLLGGSGVLSRGRGWTTTQLPLCPFTIWL